MPELTPEQRQQARTELAQSGGIARQAGMSADERTEHARRMLAARWAKRKARTETGKDPNAK